MGKGLSKTGLSLRESRQRNWTIFQLRSMHRLAGIFGDPEPIRQLIDEELVSLGAESEAARTKRLDDELEAAYRAKRGY